MKYMRFMHSVLLLCLLLPFTAEGSNLKRPVVVASTTMIESLLRDIGGDYFDILTLIPPTSCPGHFDLRPGDVQRIRGADLIICHSYQRDLQEVLRPYIPEGKKWIVIPERHSFAVPQFYREAGQALLEMLSVHFPEQLTTMKVRWSRQKDIIIEMEKECRLTFGRKGALQIPVIVAYRQKEFVESWGFRIVGVFDTLQGDSIKQIMRLVQEGKQQGVRAIVGNLQNGDRQARVFSEKLGVPFIMLSNFPGGYGRVISYEDFLKTNCARLLEIVR